MSAFAKIQAIEECPYCGHPIGSAERAHIQQVEEDRLADLRRSLENEVAASIEVEATKRVEAETLRLEREISKGLHERDKRLELANRTIETLQKQIEGKTAYELGGLQEDELVDLLRNEFPDDKISRVAGRSGADVEHHIVHEGQDCGLIIYESKNVQAWQNEFTAKLHRDKVDMKASYAVLVSTAFPAKVRDFAVVDGVPVVHPRLVTHVVHIIRKAMVEIKKGALTQQQSGFKLEQLMIYLSSPDFKNKIQQVFKSVDKLEALQQKERNSHEKLWREETLLHRQVRSCSTDIDTEIQAILSET